LTLCLSTRTHTQNTIPTITMTYTQTKTQSSTAGTCKKRYKVKEVNLKKLKTLVKKLENE